MRNEGLPDREAKPGEAVCHSCGRFVGPAARCRYCGTPVRRKISVRLFRWAAVLLATLGLAILYLMSISREVPRIEIGSISNTMNFAYINVEGVVPRTARVYSSGGIVSSVGFVIDDGTGSIPVRAYGRKGQLLVDSGNLPRAGDRIALDASLNVSADDRMLYLQVPESLEILERKEVATIGIGSLGKDDAGSVVRISGRVGRVLEPRNDRQPRLIEVKDGTGRIDLTLWDSRMTGGSRERIRAGSRVEAVGRINVFKGKLEIVPRRQGDIRIVDRNGGGSGQ